MLCLSAQVHQEAQEAKSALFRQRQGYRRILEQRMLHIFRSGGFRIVHLAGRDVDALRLGSVVGPGTEYMVCDLLPVIELVVRYVIRSSSALFD